MDYPDINELSTLVTALRELGVLYFKQGELEITLGAPPPKLPAKPAAESDEDKDELVTVESKPSRRNPLLDHPSLQRR